MAGNDLIKDNKDDDKTKSANDAAEDVEHGVMLLDPTETETTHAVDADHDVLVPSSSSSSPSPDSSSTSSSLPNKMKQETAITAALSTQQQQQRSSAWKYQALLLVALAVGLAIFIPSLLLVLQKDDNDSSNSNNKAASTSGVADPVVPSGPISDNETPPVPDTGTPVEDDPKEEEEDAQDGDETPSEENKPADQADEVDDEGAPLPAPSNDLCANAQALTWPLEPEEEATYTRNKRGSFLQVSGSTARAAVMEDFGYSRFNYDPNFGFGAVANAPRADMVDTLGTLCDWRSGTTGVWYRIQGRGVGIRASTCRTTEEQAEEEEEQQEEGEDGATTLTMPHLLSVYQGSDCGTLTCVLNYPTGCGGGYRNTLSWFGETDVTYYLYVQDPEDTSEEADATTDFTLKLAEFAPPFNDICEQAVAVKVDSTVSVTATEMSHATAEFIGGSDYSYGSVYDWEGDVLPGIWWTVQGTGKILQIAAPCDTGSAARVFVYQGSCDAKSLVGEKAICEPNSVAYFESVQGETYHILFQSDMGNNNDDNDDNDDDKATTTKQITISQGIKPTLNDMCLGALAIEPGSSVGGDLSTARYSLYYRRQRQRQRQRNLLSILQSGLYYSVVGTGQRLRVSALCQQSPEEEEGVTYPTERLDVFTGTCQEQNYYFSTSITTSLCGLGPDDSNNNSITWPSVAGQVYWIHVSPQESGRGEFVLSVDEVEENYTEPVTEDDETETENEEQQPPPPPPSSSSGAAPANDLCANAQEISWPVVTSSEKELERQNEPPPPFGSAKLTGTTALATVMEDFGYSRIDGLDSNKFGFANGMIVDQEYRMCDWRTGTTGVWYKVMGRGTGIRASTCDGTVPQEEAEEEETTTTTKPRLSVYQGNTCQTLNCVLNYGTDGCGGGSRNTLTWFGESGTTYYIYVESRSTSSGATTDSSSFTLEVTEFATPSNDVCDGAIKVDVDSTVSALAVDSTVEFINQGDSVHDWDGDVLPGVFYSFVGTSNIIKVSAPCDEETGSARIYAYEGSCNAKRIVGEVATCEPESQAYFESVEGQMYYILFQSNSREAKQLTITEEKPATNDMCLGAKQLDAGTSIKGNMNNVRNSLYYRRHRRKLYSVEQSGLFYAVMGTGNVMRASVPCTEQGTSPAYMLEVYSGDSCQGKSYIFDATTTFCEPDDVSVTWQTQPGEMYFIKAIPSYGTSDGTFALSLEDEV